MIRRLHVIANPKGGVGDNVALAERAETMLAEHGIATEMLLTEYAGHGLELVRDLNCQEGDAVCGIGGDGTMHELVNGMMQRAAADRVPLTLLPGGTGNSFLRDLECLDPQFVLDRIARQSRRSIDLFQVTIEGKVRFGFNIVGWALFSSANQLAERLRFVGRRRYDFAGLIRILGNRKFQARLSWDHGNSLEGGFTIVALSNTIHTGEGMVLAPEARLDDGKLDLVVVEAATRRDLFRLFAGLGSGAYIDDPRVRYEQVTRLELETKERLPVNLDGELVESGSFEVRVLPGALDLLI